MTRSIAYRSLGGRIQAPASKSSMQRAVACAILAGGEDGGGAAAGEMSVIRRPSRSADCLAALGVARSLGSVVEDGGDAISILGASRGAAGAASPGSKPRRLNCGESGLCIRMFSPIAALFGGEIELLAEGSLRNRPVGMVAGPLIELGASCESASGLPPLRVRGPLIGGKARVDGSESSQLLTGLLMALPLAERDSELEVSGLASRGYVDLSLDTMRAFGAVAERDEGYGRFRVPGGQRYRPADFTVEGDWSGAAFLLVAAAVAAREKPLVIEGLSRTSSQPDRAVLDALRSAGAIVEEGPEGISLRRGKLVAFDFDATDCPDLFPPLAVLALSCEGETSLHGARRLGGKESDRASALAQELGALGASISVEGDTMRVRGRMRGQGSSGPLPLAGGRVDARGDHRIAMAAAVAALLCESPIEIQGAECVAKSWPSFFEDFGSVASARGQTLGPA